MTRRPGITPALPHLQSLWRHRKTHQLFGFLAACRIDGEDVKRRQQHGASNLDLQQRQIAPGAGALAGDWVRHLAWQAADTLLGRSVRNIERHTKARAGQSFFAAREQARQTWPRWPRRAAMQTRRTCRARCAKLPATAPLNSCGCWSQATRATGSTASGCKRRLS